MRSGVAAVLLFIISAVPASADALIQVELNAAEGAAGKCRLSFVVENASMTPIETVKLELVLFGRDGVIRRRLDRDGPRSRPKNGRTHLRGRGRMHRDRFDSRQ